MTENTVPTPDETPVTETVQKAAAPAKKAVKKT